ncbi:uncharacterized protein C8orf76 homolog [Carlito syrichta]|uniref:Uncharacterized protein C8orf76 homolog n=1 Tax=Carlito syrichta TaxID=1868482 RepID=A0A3Q0DIH1_CARSF|nr:uncharacterized protein C8orf76 homolog [Carlito syrichta]
MRTVTSNSESDWENTWTPTAHLSQTCESQRARKRRPTPGTSCARGGLDGDGVRFPLYWLARPLSAPFHFVLTRRQWFHEETESSDDAEALTVKKFRGDLAYRRQEFQKALQEYSSVSAKLSSSHFAMKRDVQEGQARCLAHLGRHVEALEMAVDLENKATNTDHLTAVLYLQLAICSSLRNLEETIFCLQKLISLHPFYPWNWSRLAEAYLSQGPAPSAAYTSSQKQDSFASSDRTVRSSSPRSGKDYLLCFPEGLPESSVFGEASGRNSQKKESALPNTQHCLADEREAKSLETRVKACASLMRTRLLLQLSQPQQASFALERNLRTQQEVGDKMRALGFGEDALLLVAEVMGEDIFPEKMRGDLQPEVECVGPAALAALVTTTSEEFEDKWFRKIKDHFCPSEGHFLPGIQVSAAGALHKQSRRRLSLCELSLFVSDRIPCQSQNIGH